MFLDGCFWHCCPVHFTAPQANASYWEPKLAGNCARDRATDERLAAAGWCVMRVWEHEAPNAAAGRVQQALEALRGELAAPSR